MSDFIAVTCRNQSDERGAKVVEKDGKLFLYVWDDSRAAKSMREGRIKNPDMFDEHLNGFFENTYLPIIRILSTAVAREHNDGSYTTVSIYEVADACEFTDSARIVSHYLWKNLVIEELRPIND